MCTDWPKNKQTYTNFCVTLTYFSKKYPKFVEAHCTTQKGTALEMSLGLLLWGHFNEFKTAWKLLQLYKGEEKETL